MTRWCNAGGVRGSWGEGWGMPGLMGSEGEEKVWGTKQKVPS
jgi:hypothetical protein